MEAKRNNEALFALEFIKNIKDEVRSLESYELSKIIDIAVDMVFDKPLVESEAEILETLGEEEGGEVINYIARQKEIDRKFLSQIKHGGMEDFD